MFQDVLFSPHVPRIGERFNCHSRTTGQRTTTESVLNCQATPAFPGHDCYLIQTLSGLRYAVLVIPAPPLSPPPEEADMSPSKAKAVVAATAFEMPRHGQHIMYFHRTTNPTLMQANAQNSDQKVQPRPMRKFRFCPERHPFRTRLAPSSRYRTHRARRGKEKSDYVSVTEKANAFLKRRTRYWTSHQEWRFPPAPFTSVPPILPGRSCPLSPNPSLPQTHTKKTQNVARIRKHASIFRLVWQRNRSEGLPGCVIMRPGALRAF